MIGSVYICAAPRSGSTLLDLLLGAHPQMVAVGELNHLPKNIALGTVCSCGQTVRECPFWMPIVDRIGAELGRDLWSDPYALDLGFVRAAVQVDRRRQTRGYLLRRMASVARVEVAHRLNMDLARSPWLAGFRQTIGHLIHLHRVIREVSGARVVVDANKGFRHSVSHYRMRPDDTRLIVLSRDGRGVMASYMRSGRSREDALRQWEKYYERALPWIERHVDRAHVLHLRYEDVVSDPQAAIGRVVEFLGLDPVGEPSGQVPRQTHILNGNKMRLAPLSEIKLDERWRTELSVDDQAYFLSHGVKMSARLGHELTPGL